MILVIVVPVRNIKNVVLNFKLIIMKITKTYNWSRRDFSYDMKCEHCNHEVKNNGGGYDDSFYYNNVIPSIKCPKCKESSNSKETEAPKSIVVPKHDPNIIM